MTQPLAILNGEELHWLGDLGLPNQRRWLNHRTLGDEHRRTFPSAARIVTQHPEPEKRLFDPGVLYCFLALCFVFCTWFAGVGLTKSRDFRRRTKHKALSTKHQVQTTRLSLTTASPAFLVRVRGWSGPSIGDRAFRHIQRCGRRVGRRPARACS